MSVQEIRNSVINYERDKVPELVKAELDVGTAILKILDDGLILAMEEVGKNFSEGKIYIPEMLRAALAMKNGMEVLRPLLASSDTKTKGTIVIGTVKGDLHDIGKNLVSVMLEGAGFEVINVGVDVGSEKFISSAEENHADIVALSALLTTTMPAMEETVDSIKCEGLPVKTMVGGAPVTEEFANKIGANGYGADAPSAVQLAKRLLSN